MIYFFSFYFFLISCCASNIYSEKSKRGNRSVLGDSSGDSDWSQLFVSSVCCGATAHCSAPPSTTLHHPLPTSATHYHPLSPTFTHHPLGLACATCVCCRRSPFVCIPYARVCVVGSSLVLSVDFPFLLSPLPFLLSVASFDEFIR